jgi:uncharacterized protein (DUF2236 family)
LFEPGSVSWRIDRENLVLAGGTCALLMQVAHPSVAAGVAAHSNFRADPFARLRRTLGASWAIVFGGAPRAERAIRRVNAIHASVSGVVPETGTPYRALDPVLLLWVHATLVDTAVRIHDRFVEPLSEAEMNAYHREAATVAFRLGVPESLVPETLADLRAWMDSLITSREVQVGATARELAPAILYPARFPPRFLWDAAHLASISVLPATLRRQYGIPWNRRRARAVERVAAVTRQIAPWIPPALRHVPASRTAEARRG